MGKDMQLATSVGAATKRERQQQQKYQEHNLYKQH